jgi:hypothetical protein
MAILSSLLCAFVSIGFPDQSLGHDGRTANPIGRRNDTAVALNTAIAADQFSPDFTGKNGVRH